MCPELWASVRVFYPRFIWSFFPVNFWLRPPRRWYCLASDGYPGVAWEECPCEVQKVGLVGMWGVGRSQTLKDSLSLTHPFQLMEMRDYNAPKESRAMSMTHTNRMVYL